MDINVVSKTFVVRVNRPEIRFRDTVRQISDFIRDSIKDIAGESTIYLDFQDVYFVSRAAADQFLCMEEELKLKIERINVCAGVKVMFEIVSRTNHRKTTVC